MILSRQLSPSSLIALCRALRHGLGAGLTLVRVFRQQAERGPHGTRLLAGRIVAVLEQGYSLSDALESEKELLPPFFLSLAHVGEETGHLAEIFGELEEYYLLQDKLRKQFRAQSALPLIQLGLSFFIIAGLILVLGMIAASRPGAVAKGLFGLRGAGGAVLFLIISFGSIGLTWFLAVTLGRLARQQPGVDAFLLRLPVVGPCLQAITMGRFTMALHVTLDSGMPIARALQLSLEASANALFVGQTQTVVHAVKNGTSLLEAFTRSGLFRDDFLHLVAVGEESGRVPEVMRQQADYWNEEAARRLKTATRLASLLVWLLYATFMVWAIFSIYSGALGIG
jgi:type II secretory pathway component PulF